MSKMKPQNITHSQRGATLIIVLVVMLVIAIVSVTAVRMSTADLKVATASQVQKLNFQVVDASLAKLEAEARTKRAIEPTGMLGFLRISDKKIGREVVFCFKPQSGKFFSLAALTEKEASGTVGAYSTGECNPAVSTDYISHRQANMVQMSVTRTTYTGSSEAFGYEFELSTLPSQRLAGRQSPIKPMSVKAVSTSLLPAFGTASNADITECMKKNASTDANSVNKCLENEGTPFHQQEQTYALKPEGLPLL